MKKARLRLGAARFTFVCPFSKSGHESMLFKCAKLETVAFWDAYLEGVPRRKPTWRRMRW